MALRQCDEPPRRVTHGQLPLPSGPSAPKQIPTYKQKPSPPKHAMELIEGICMCTILSINKNMSNILIGFKLGPDHVQVYWKHKYFGNTSQLESRPLIG